MSILDNRGDYAFHATPLTFFKHEDEPCLPGFEHIQLTSDHEVDEVLIADITGDPEGTSLMEKADAKITQDGLIRPSRDFGGEAI